MKTICPYCRTPIEGDDVPECPACGIPHHLECWLENNGCSIPGCSQAPEDEPKVRVGSGEPGLSARRSRGMPVSEPTRGRRVASVEDYAPKSRTRFMVLGLILGPFGIHNFYAGYTLRGSLQLGLTCVTLFYGAVASWVWALLEVVLVSHDGIHRRMD